MAILEELRKKWYAINAPLGKELGFPECCIKEFCNQPPEILNAQKPGKNSKLRYDASLINGKYSGFIPCLSHAKKILSGEITLKSLIKNRDKKHPPFPNY